MSDNEEDKNEPLTQEEIEENDKLAKDLALQSTTAVQAYIATSALLAGMSTGITDEAIYVALSALAKSSKMIMMERGGWTEDSMKILDDVAGKIGDGLAHPEKIAQMSKELEAELREKGIKVPGADEKDDDFEDLASLMGAPTPSKKLVN